MPTTSFNTSRAVRLALIAAAATSLAACQRPKPEPVAPTPPPPAATPAPETPPPAPPVAQGPLPGTEQDFVINVGDRVYFDLDSYSVRDDAAPVLDAQAAWLNRYPSVMVRIEGNADERGTREYNLGLGSRRANAVRDYLVNRGVASSRISTVSYGKERPIDPGTTEDAYQRNRNAHTAIVSGAR
ncbi:MAG: peptidoglycan-associated lipoprotein Pal [Phenylobacterium sp.]|uniref:peptidoglycan-associated lipoprotein Pal n=1 Tax=Phenylobacterium sp. TaxID=1871053 RepID=UPI00391B91BB